MKQKVRLIESSNASYNFLTIQLLDESNSSSKILMGSFSSIGSITFQQTKGEDEWYGMRFVFDNHRVNELVKFCKVVKLIQKKAEYRSQPKEILEILNAEEYYIFKNEFIKLADKGKMLFNVIRNGSVYSRMIANDSDDATKKLERFKNLRELDNGTFTLGDRYVIQ